MEICAFAHLLGMSSSYLSHYCARREEMELDGRETKIWAEYDILNQISGCEIIPFTPFAHVEHL